jgi:hypothetical protein
MFVEKTSWAQFTVQTVGITSKFSALAVKTLLTSSEFSRLAGLTNVLTASSSLWSSERTGVALRHLGQV